MSSSSDGGGGGVYVPGHTSLLREAWSLLQRIHCTVQGPIEVVVSSSDGAVRLIFRGKLSELTKGVHPMPEPDRPETAPASWRWLSPLEEQIVRAVNASDWTPAVKIADACGCEVSTELKAILRNLVERGVLVSGPSRGYKLSLGDGD